MTLVSNSGQRPQGFAEEDVLMAFVRGSLEAVEFRQQELIMAIHWRQAKGEGIGLRRIVLEEIQNLQTRHPPPVILTIGIVPRVQPS
jgi:hypothetical protein